MGYVWVIYSLIIVCRWVIDKKWSNWKRVLTLIGLVPERIRNG